MVVNADVCFPFSHASPITYDTYLAASPPALSSTRPASQASCDPLPRLPTPNVRLPAPRAVPWSSPCPGIPLRWEGLPFWKTYPFHIHDPDSKERPGYNLVAIEPPQIRSMRCLGPEITAQGVLPCTRCRDLTVDVDVLKERAGRNYQRINAEEALNNIQIREKLGAAKERENSLKLKNVNLANSLKAAQTHLSEFKDVFNFIAHHSVPALHRIFLNAGKKGWSAKTLRRKLQLAVDGDYHAKNFSQYEIDLAIVLYELGGAAAVYAMNHSIFALPSLNTIQPFRRQNNIVPCVDGLRFTDISENITALFGPHKVRNGTKSGAMTEIKPILSPHTLSFDEVAAERKIDYMPATDKMAGLCTEHIAALDTVKIGKNIETVEAAVTAVREGKVHVAQEITVGAISRLSETGYGAKPVLMAPSCKRGDWKECLRAMEIVLEAWRRSPDGEKKHGEIVAVAADGDKKRRAAMFILTMHSEILPGNPLYPFVQALLGLNLRVGRNNLTGDSDWKHLDKRLITCLLSPLGIAVKEDFDPSEMQEFEAICLLAEVFDAQLQPFINTTLSISEQITSLVQFSHLLCALYLQNGPSFLPNQLYGDLQTMVKNAVLMVPKTRLINGQLKVFICLLGDDVLEALFGRSRIIGGHSPNSSTAELQHRFNSALILDHIFEQHPELELKPRRLALFRMRDFDHLRPRHFTGELRADSCDLDSCWKIAVQNAEEILRKFRVKMVVPFAELFKRADTDLMRPFGGKYPAISAEVDRSMVNLSSYYDDTASTIDPSTINPNKSTLTVDFDELIACETAQRVAESREGPHSVFAEIDADGHLCHKKAVVRTLFDMTHDMRSSHDRLQRVRGFTIGGKSWTREDNPDNEKVSASTHFQLGNLFTTLVCYNGTHLGLAVAKCTLIKRGSAGSKSASVSAIPLGELHLSTSPYTLSGRVFSLIPLTADSNPRQWAWNGQFISFSLLKKKSAGTEEISRLRNLQFCVSSCLIDPIHEKARDVNTVDLEVPFDRENTWVFSDKDLLESWYRLWNRLLANTALHDKFPRFTGICDGEFPYKVASSAVRCTELQGIVYSSPIAGTAIEESNITRHTCRICQKVVKDTDRQMHIGQHILKTLCGVADSSAKFPVSNSYPCGTCGGPTSDGACKIQIKSGKVDSNCPSAYPFLISAPAKFKETRPCTNVPIVCPFRCDETHWKYNFHKHLADRHPSWRDIISPTFLTQIQITRAEQLALQIPAGRLFALDIQIGGGGGGYPKWKSRDSAINLPREITCVVIRPICHLLLRAPGRLLSFRSEKLTRVTYSSHYSQLRLAPAKQAGCHWSWKRNSARSSGPGGQRVCCRC
ncbi:hypothetical protein B0H13DRAFT_2402726 [Mycena leptocephala]|nr:hypothetical protein B0H13DRAFT_2402726 [Mycena leptocephala]